jgi:hypothetical protein
MKARQLIEENVSLGPEELVVLCAALEDSWSSVRTWFADEQSRQDARVKLAGMILLLARSGLAEPEALKNAAIEMMRCQFEP